MRVQFRVNAYAFGDVSLLSGDSPGGAPQAEDGSLHAHPPSDAPNHLPDFMLTWVGSLWDYYFHTGHVGLLKECLPAMQAADGIFRKARIAGWIDRRLRWLLGISGLAESLQE
jgi:hypothetical protein